MPAKFVVFHPEKRKNNIQEKIANLYMNRLCINENDQNELIAINKWRVMDTIDNLSFVTNMFLRFINFASEFMLENQFSYQGKGESGISMIFDGLKMLSENKCKD